MHHYLKPHPYPGTKHASLQQGIEPEGGHREQGRGWEGRWAPQETTDRIHGLEQRVQAVSQEANSKSDYPI